MRHACIHTLCTQMHTRHYITSEVLELCFLYFNSTLHIQCVNSSLPAGSIHFISVVSTIKLYIAKESVLVSYHIRHYSVYTWPLALWSQEHNDHTYSLHYSCSYEMAPTSLFGHKFSQLCESISTSRQSLGTISPLPID